MRSQSSSWLIGSSQTLVLTPSTVHPVSEVHAYDTKHIQTLALRTSHATLVNCYSYFTIPSFFLRGDTSRDQSHCCRDPIYRVPACRSEWEVLCRVMHHRHATALIMLAQACLSSQGLSSYC